MKVVTVLGTRPEIIRLSRIIPLLDAQCEHVLVHTGQNYDDRLSGIFFSGLNVRAPDVWLSVQEDSFAKQVASILSSTEQVLIRERPDRVLVLGDTNSGLAAFVARRLGLPVFHLEAGNRCYDDRVPEEINRRVIDHCSTVLMPYTERSRANLLREGMDPRSIYVVGNPIFEVLQHHAAEIDTSDALRRMGLQASSYLLATTHRQENVDQAGRLRAIARSLQALAEQYSLPVIWVVHPRTRSKLDAFAIDVDPATVRIVEPLGFADFIALERAAACVLTDSGTVQEECCILRIPNVTLRDVTERPETLECGSNILAGVEPDDVLRATSLALARGATWNPPPEYLAPSVAATVAAITLGYLA